MTAAKLLRTSTLVLSLLVSSTFADDWPQWRGPNRDGISKETGLLKQWPKDGPRLIWQQKTIGAGYSTPAIIGDRIYLLSNSGPNAEAVVALEASDGQRVWSTPLGKVGNPEQDPNYPGARSTPTVDGELLFALGSDGDLICVDAAKGAVHWKKNLRADFGGMPGIWAYAESPLIDGDTLVCTPGGKSATVVALNKKSGDVIWKFAAPAGDESGYSSVMIANINGAKEYVQFLQKGLVGLDAATGKLLWHYDETARGSQANIPTPIVSGDLVYSSAGQSGGGLVKISGNPPAAKQIYFDKKLPNAIGDVVLIGDNLYGTTSTVLMCVDFKTAKDKWKNRSIGTASILYADGNLYLHGENGDVAMVQAAPDAYHELGRFTPPDQPDRGNAKAWAFPVIANGRLYIRDQNMLWCYDVKGNVASK
jgi:outer membrane protein assembly factor BamB